MKDINIHNGAINFVFKGGFMKRTCILIIMLLVFMPVLSGCDNDKNAEVIVKVRDDDATATPIQESVLNTNSQENDKYVSTWYGVGIYDRCQLTTLRDGEELMGSLEWGNSANSSYQYKFSGKLHNDKLIYYNLVETEVIVDESNNRNEKVINEKVSGELYFHDNVVLWNNNGQTAVLAKEDAYVQNATKEDYSGQYEGFGLYENASMKFSQKGSQITGTITCIESASEQSIYTFSGTIDGNQSILENIKVTERTYRDDGTFEETVKTENATGMVWLSKDFITVNSDEYFIIPFVK